MNEEKVVNIKVEEEVKEVEVDIFDKAIARLEKEIYVRTQNIKKAKHGIRANKHLARQLSKPQYQKNGYAEHWVDNNGTPFASIAANRVPQLGYNASSANLTNERDERLLEQMIKHKDNKLYREYLTPFILASGMATDFSEDELLAIKNAEKVDGIIQSEEEVKEEIEKLLEDEKIEEELKEQEKEQIDEPKEH